MRRILLKATAIAVLCSGLSSVIVTAEETEGTTAVPTRTDPSNPDTAVYRASDIMNVPVKGDDGAEIGKIKDLVINGESREVLYAVVAMNDGKEKDALYVIPWTGFQPSYGRGNTLAYTTLAVPQSVWIQAPFYSPVQWRQAGYSQWGPRVNNFYSAHINVNSNNGNSNSVTTRKPVINDDNKNGNDPKNPNTNKPKPTTEPKPTTGPKSGEKPGTNESPKPKTNPAPAPTEKPKAKQVEPDTKLPAPKNPDPAGPKVPPPAPKDPKVPK